MRQKWMFTIADMFQVRYININELYLNKCSMTKSNVTKYM